MRFRVKIADRDTGEEQEIDVDAVTVGEARAKAGKAGYLVGTVTPIFSGVDTADRNRDSHLSESTVDHNKARISQRIRLRPLLAKSKRRIGIPLAITALIAVIVTILWFSLLRDHKRIVIGQWVVTGWDQGEVDGWRIYTFQENGDWMLRRVGGIFSVVDLTKGKWGSDGNRITMTEKLRRRSNLGDLTSSGETTWLINGKAPDNDHVTVTQLPGNAKFDLTRASEDIVRMVRLQACITSGAKNVKTLRLFWGDKDDTSFKMGEEGMEMCMDELRELGVFGRIDEETGNITVNGWAWRMISEIPNGRDTIACIAWMHLVIQTGKKREITLFHSDTGQSVAWVHGTMDAKVFR